MAVLTWPAHEPDLNIIENVRYLMEEVLYSDKSYDDWKELICALEQCAKKFNKESLLKVIDVKAPCQRDLIFLPLHVILWEFCRFVL